MHFVSAFSFLLSSSPVRLKVAVPVRNAHSTLAVSGLAQNPAVIIRSVQACVCVFTWSSWITLMHTAFCYPDWNTHTHSLKHTYLFTHSCENTKNLKKKVSFLFSATGGRFIFQSSKFSFFFFFFFGCCFVFTCSCFFTKQKITYFSGSLEDSSSLPFVRRKTQDWCETVDIPFYQCPMLAFALDSIAEPEELRVWRKFPRTGPEPVSAHPVI